jgi:hypothetical protein
MQKSISTYVALPRELRRRLDDHNREHHLGDNLTNEITRRLEWSFRMEDRFAAILQEPKSAVERVLEGAFGSRIGEAIPSGAYNGRGEHVMDTAQYETGIRRDPADPDPRAIKYIVVGRLPYGERTFLDTPEAAIAHAKNLIDRPNTGDKKNPLLIAEVITVVEREVPIPPPVQTQVRAPRKSDFPQ